MPWPCMTTRSVQRIWPGQFFLFSKEPFFPPCYPCHLTPKARSFDNISGYYQPLMFFPLLHKLSESFYNFTPSQRNFLTTSSQLFTIFVWYLKNSEMGISVLKGQIFGPFFSAGLWIRLLAKKHIIRGSAPRTKGYC